MSLQVIAAVKELVKARLAAIPNTPVNGYPVSPITWSATPSETRLFFERRTSTAPLPHAWFRLENVAAGRPTLPEHLGFPAFDAWVRNREEAEAVRRVMMFLDGYSVGTSSAVGAITYSLNSSNVLTEETAQHLSMIFEVSYVEEPVAV